MNTKLELVDSELIGKMVTLVSEINHSDEIIECDYLTGGYAEDYHPLVTQLVAAAEELCIASDGTVRFSMIAQLARHGVIIRRGEYDSFGWLSGVVITKKGLVVYG